MAEKPYLRDQWQKAIETPKADKPIYLEISWRREGAVDAEILSAGFGVLRFDDTRRAREEYDAMYATSGLVFLHYRTEVKERDGVKCYDNFVELRIGIEKLTRYGSCWCTLKTLDATAWGPDIRPGTDIWSFAG